MATQIIKCTCKHPFQDSVYGVGNRVGNVMRTGQVKCTVCGTVGGSKAVFTKSETTVAAAPVAAKVDKKADKKEEKGKKTSKSKSAPKPKIDRSKKMGKK